MQPTPVQISRGRHTPCLSHPDPKVLTLSKHCPAHKTPDQRPSMSRRWGIRNLSALPAGVYSVCDRRRECIRGVTARLCPRLGTILVEKQWQATMSCGKSAGTKKAGYSSAMKWELRWVLHRFWLCSSLWHCREYQPRYVVSKMVQSSTGESHARLRARRLDKAVCRTLASFDSHSPWDIMCVCADSLF